MTQTKIQQSQQIPVQVSGSKDPYPFEIHNTGFDTA